MKNGLLPHHKAIKHRNSDKAILTFIYAFVDTAKTPDESGLLSTT